MLWLHYLWVIRTLKRDATNISGSVQTFHVKYASHAISNILEKIVLKHVENIQVKIMLPKNISYFSIIVSHFTCYTVVNIQVKMHSVKSSSMHLLLYIVTIFNMEILEYMAFCPGLNNILYDFTNICVVSTANNPSTILKFTGYMGGGYSK